MEKVLDNEYADLYVYPEKKIVHHKIKKFIYGKDFQDLMLTGVAEFEKHGCYKYLSDDRGVTTLRKEDIEWGQGYWEKKMFECGWKFWALVMPEKVIGQMNLQRVVERYSEFGVTVEVFNDPDEAMAWLEKQE